jgi:probable HAF family extracellular repeat protein
MQDLGSGIAHGVSADGAVVVGVEKGDFYWDSAFRWTAEGGMQDLGMLHGYELASWAYGVSADGAVVVGGAEGLIDWLAFRWTAEGGMQDLDTLGGSSDAHAVSADGSVVVGGADITSGQSRAFRWTAENGMQDLNQLYADLLKNGSYLEIAFAISPDGRYIVGQGYNAATKRKEAFLLDTLGKPSQ